MSRAYRVNVAQFGMEQPRTFPCKALRATAFHIVCALCELPMQAVSSGLLRALSMCGTRGYCLAALPVASNLDFTSATPSMKSSNTRACRLN